MKPLPISPSALDTFVNCPRQYHHKYVLKDLPPEVKTPEQTYGEWVHKAFQQRLEEGLALPGELAHHEKHMRVLEDKPGMAFYEQRVGLTRKLQPCSWDMRDEIWFRGIIDFNKVDRESRSACIDDYKTGKPHSKFSQLGLYAIWLFIMYPWVDLINAQFYWTRDGTVTKKIWGRADQDEIWALVLADLKQFSLAFKFDTWQERPSGLCHGWCPVKSCEHWKPKRVHT